MEVAAFISEGAAFDARSRSVWCMPASFLQVRGVVNQHIASYNHFVTVGLKNILKANALIRSEVRTT